MTTADELMQEAEQALFDSCLKGYLNSSTIFILGAPRTGSTYLYQLVVRLFGLPFISNLTNAYFPTTPIVGLALQHGVDVRIIYESQYGKSDGPFQPSEGSGPMAHWFGGGQPSQVASHTILGGRSTHFQNTLAACEVLYEGRPLVIKNAWNCFRVACIAETLPAARFLWIRRDVRDAAASDLEARIATKGRPDAWNSATPANVEALQTRPPHEQVVENQYEFSKAVGEALAALQADRWHEIWYEDLIRQTHPAVDSLAAWLALQPREAPPKGRAIGPRAAVRNENARAIADFVTSDPGRFASLCHGGRD